MRANWEPGAEGKGGGGGGAESATAQCKMQKNVEEYIQKRSKKALVVLCLNSTKIRWWS